MFVTLTHIQNRAATILQLVVDNTGGKLHVALQGFHYEVGYRNVGSSSGIQRRFVDGNLPKKIKVPPGLYSFKQLSQFIMKEMSGVTR